MTEPVAGVRPPDPKRQGLYVHIPFCDKVCPYCDFAVSANRRHDHTAYVRSVLEQARAARLSVPVHTVYFGGGTPSMLQPEALQLLGDGLRERFDLGAVEEWTLEANPTDISPEALDRWARCGVGRVSLGCQSFDDGMLGRLGRNHSGARALSAARAILEDGRFALSIDLIYGGPGQDMALWRQDLARLRELDGLGHVSAYQLTIEPRTPFARAHARGELQVAEADLQVELLDALIETLGSMGITQYEVSSFARPGAHALHNSSYWLGHAYLGLGVGAHGLEFEGGQVVRTANTRAIKAYMDDPVGAREQERLSAHEHLWERLFVNVRTRLGLDFDGLRAQFEGAVDPSVWEALSQGFQELERGGLLQVDDASGRWLPTKRGMLLGDLIGMRLESWLVDCQGS